MKHVEVFDLFKKCFPRFANSTDRWWPNGKNSIRVCLKNSRQHVFTYNNPKDWSMETLDRFVKRLKGAK